jgi:putative addiction module component (TIGR02574 family)
MTELLERIEKDSAALSEHERVQLAEFLIESVQRKEHTNRMDLWAKEAQDRVNAVRSGDLKTVPFDTVKTRGQ